MPDESEAVKTARAEGKTEGREEGRIEATLQEHSRHLLAVNGSQERAAKDIEDVKRTLHDGFRIMDMAIQKLTDQAESREKAVDKAAEAVESDRQARKESTEERYSPWQKVFAVIAVLSILLNAYLTLFRK